ncbi:MAG TPA: SRPBCC family protein [Puia sp.]|nr:SRPBCC family protein [Puia sp.]
MRVLKLTLVIFFSIAIFLSAFSLLFPPHLHIARNVNIDANITRVLKVIGDLHTWSKWNAIVNDTVLTNLKISKDGKEAESDQLDLQIKPDSTQGIFIVWRKRNGQKFYGGIKLFNAGPDSVSLQWYFDFAFSWWPWEKFSSLVYDRQFQPIIEQSLNNLKRLIENNP